MRLKPLDKEIKSNIRALRSKCCKRIIKSASENDNWNGDRFCFLNRYFYELEGLF